MDNNASQEISSFTNDTQVNANEAQNEVIIVKDSDSVASGIDVDISRISTKELAQFTKSDLKQMCKDRNLFKDLKKWEIDRLNRAQLAKLLKSHCKEDNTTHNSTETHEEALNDEPKEETPNYSSIDLSLLNKGVSEAIKGQDPLSFDLLANQIVQNSEVQPISTQTLERLHKLAYVASICHLTIRNLIGGYSNMKFILKRVYNKLRGVQTEEYTTNEEKSEK